MVLQVFYLTSNIYTVPTNIIIMTWMVMYPAIQALGPYVTNNVGMEHVRNRLVVPIPHCTVSLWLCYGDG